LDYIHLDLRHLGPVAPLAEIGNALYEC